MQTKAFAQAQGCAPPHPQAGSRPQPLTHGLMQGAGLTRRHTLAALFAGPWCAPVAWSKEAPPQVAAQAITQAQTQLPVQGQVQLAMPWPRTRSPHGFLVSEKLDGVRAVWDGRVLRFRSGRVLTTPAWFVSGWPAEALDGELWIGRGAFDLDRPGLHCRVQHQSANSRTRIQRRPSQGLGDESAHRPN